MAELRKSLRAIFDEASELSDEEARRAFLDQACGDDAALRAEVEELLRSQEMAGGFLADPKRTMIQETVPAMEQEGDRIGRYKLLQKIGEGGCGIVYMAEQTEPVRRRVALKVIKLGMDTRSVIARFEAERQALAMMDHANIARVLDGGATDTGRPYFVMELVRGIRITDYCERNNLSTRARLELFIHVCQAVQHAHQKGIIHRDIKPSNVLVTSDDGVPMPKVIDFGIAKATSDIQLTDKTLFTRFEMFIGTSAYMSPEQAEFNASDIDTRTDIYSLGVLLYELLTGYTPFDGDELLKSGLDAMRKIIREREPLRPSTRLTREFVSADVSRRKSTQDLAVPTPEEASFDARGRLRLKDQITLLRGDLDWIALKSLEKDRTRRYDTANGLAMDIQRFLADEPILARPPSAAYKFRKAFRRNKLAVTAAAAVALSLVLGITASTWQAVRATRARNEETRQRQLAQTAQLEAQARQLEAEQQRQLVQESDTKTRGLLYAANLNLVQSSFEQQNIAMARLMLGQTRSHPDRGFEWYYWQRELHRPTRILRGHAGHVERVAFSPDGRRILTQGEDDVVLIRDAASGVVQLQVKAGKFLQFSPDGQRILCSLNQCVQIRSASTGDELTSTDLVSLGTFTPDGKQFATVRGQRASFRDAVTGRELSSFRAFNHDVQWFANPIFFSPDGRWMLAAQSSLHGGMVLHDAVTGEIAKIFAKGDFVNTGAFSPDGRRIVTWELWSGEPAIWDIAQPDRPLARLPGLSGGRVTFSPDGRRLLTGGDDHRATLWDAETFKLLGRFEGHTGAIRDVAFSPDGQRVATASNDGTARIWATATFTGPRVLQDPAIHVGAFSPDGRYLATGRDGVAVIWETATGKPLRRLKVYHPVPGKIRAHDEADVTSLSFSPDGRRLVAAGANFVAIVFDVESGHPLRTLDHPSTNSYDRRVTSAVFSPDGKQIVTMNNLKVRTWDAESGQLRRTKVYNKTNDLHLIPPVGFTPDGRVYCASNEELTLWDPVTDEEVFHLPMENAKMHNPHHPSIAFSPDGKRFALSCLKWRGTIQIHEAASGRLLGKLQGHREGVSSLEFSPDGARLLSGSFDATAKIWDLGSSRELLSFKAPDVVKTVRFTPDGRMIFAGGHFKDGLLWEAATPEQVAAWETEEVAGATQWAAMTETFYQRRAAGWAADDEAGKANRASFVKATEEKLARLGDPALLGKLPGAIRQWLALSVPHNYQHPEIQLDDEQIANEAQIRPRAKETALLPQERVWTALQLEDYRLDFRTAIKSDDAATVAYAVSYILSERDQTGLVLKVGSDYHAKIYLNQREIYRCVNPATAEPDRDTVTGVELKAGLNVLVFKVVRRHMHGDRPWNGSVRFATADGGSVPGLTVTLDPDAVK